MTMRVHSPREVSISKMLIEEPSLDIIKDGC